MYIYIYIPDEAYTLNPKPNLQAYCTCRGVAAAEAQCAEPSGLGPRGLCELWNL